MNDRILVLNAGSSSVKFALFDAPSPALAVLQGTIESLRRAHEEWQAYSYDKRTRPSPYLDDCEVGYLDGKRRDVKRYEDRLDACADFIVREARSMLTDP